MEMQIHRCEELTPVRDFMTNVRPKLKDDSLAEEMYDKGELIGWRILKIN